MKLSKFEVRDYKSCTRTTITPSEGLTVLIGANGAGKSNILTARGFNGGNGFAHAAA
jgi:recombinational DNA repair ATPase RecF